MNESRLYATNSNGGVDGSAEAKNGVANVPNWQI